MKSKGIFTLGLFILVAACGDKSPVPGNDVQSPNSPIRRVALQDLVDQKKISYATAIQCLYLADATKNTSDDSERNDSVKYNAKFYALQLLQDNPSKIEADVGTTSFIHSGGFSEHDEVKQKQLDSDNKKEFEKICVPLFWERQ